MLRTVLTTCSLLFSLINAFPQQCTFPSHIFLPTPDRTANESYATSIDIHNDYMVAGAYANDSLNADAGVAYVYKLNAVNKWERIAELVPSDAGKSSWFGRIVSIFENTIAIWGRTYDDSGRATVKIYIFEKQLTGEWSSGSESYQLPGVASVFDFSLHQNELVIICGYDGKIGMKIFTKSGGVFSLSQTIDAPLDTRGTSGSFGESLGVADDFIAVGAGQFRNADGTTGVVFVFEKDAGLYKLIPARLRPAKNPYLTFGRKLAVNNSTIFAGTLDKLSGATLPHPIIYIYERPATGWVNATESISITSDEPVYFEFELAASEQYLFTTGPAYESVLGFKKTASNWLADAEEFKIDHSVRDVLFGYQIDISGQHLVIGSPERPNNNGATDEYIVDYFTDTGEWENVSDNNQIVRGSVNLNATNDFFGAGLSIYGNHLAVAASGDDETGSNAGAVYIFNTEEPEDAPVKIFSPETQAGTSFGMGLAIGDSVLFVGAPGQDSVNIDGTVQIYAIGKVFVYRLTSTGWRFQNQIIGPVVESQVYFGRTIAWHSGYLAINEYDGGSSESIGLVHIYKETSARDFVYLGTLNQSSQVHGDHFGSQILMNDSLIVVATGGGESHPDALKVYIYRKRGEWKAATEDAVLTSSDKVWGDGFGSSIAMDGVYIVVGANRWTGENPINPSTALYRGAAYIFKRPTGGWNGRIQEIARLLPSDPSDHNYFGRSVGIDHNDIFVGAPHSFSSLADGTPDVPTHRPGKIYHYTKTHHEEWKSSSQELRQLTSFEPDNRDGYGSALFISDRYLYSGAPFDNTSAGSKSGSVQTIMQLPVIEPIPLSCINGPSVALHAFPSRGGVWSGKGVNQASRTFDPEIAGEGVHQLIYMVSGCTDTATAEVDEVVDIQIAPPTIICSDTRIKLVATPPGGSWSGAGLTATGKINSTPLTDGSFLARYHYVTTRGCQWRDSVNVRVDKLQMPQVIQEGETVCQETPVILDLDGVDQNTTVQWFKNQISVGNQVSLQVRRPGRYTATVSKHGCSLDVGPVTLEGEPDSLYVPNIFTPNADAFNDFFEIRGTGMNQFDLTIFNRYGLPVFEANDPVFKWDGSVAAGVYFWRITYVGCNEEVKERKGWVQVMP
jgi:gliding motility-associated-like protein